MTITTLKLVTIIAEPVLEERLVRLLHELGATGHTITEGRGEGSRHRHATTVPGETLRLEVIVGAETADRILHQLADQYFATYSMIAWLADVQVLRREKYTG